MTPLPKLEHRRVLDDPTDGALTAADLAAGAVVGHGFANFYALSTRPDAATVRRVNLMKGRPVDQVGSVTTSRSHLAAMWDWSRLPPGLTARRVLAVVDDFFGLGPFGFRGPAARHLPSYLVERSPGGSSAQVIGPGYACPSTVFLDQALRACRSDHLYITSANRSRHLTGEEDSPAHWTAAGLRQEFAAEPDFRLLEHHDEAAARARYPLFAPMSTTILGFAGPATVDGRPALVLERVGSLPAHCVAAVLDAHGLALAVAPSARRRLQQRTYPAVSTF